MLKGSQKYCFASGGATPRAHQYGTGPPAPPNETDYHSHPCGIRAAGALVARCRPAAGRAAALWPRFGTGGRRVREPLSPPCGSIRAREPRSSLHATLPRSTVPIPVGAVWPTVRDSRTERHATDLPDTNRPPLGAVTIRPPLRLLLGCVSAPLALRYSEAIM